MKRSLPDSRIEIKRKIWLNPERWPVWPR